MTYGEVAFGIMEFLAKTILTISSNDITITQTHHAIAAETGTTEDLHNIFIDGDVKTSEGGNTYRPTLALIADAGDTITLKHGTGNLDLPDNVDIDLTDDKILWLTWNGTNWNAYHSGSDGTLTSVATGTGLQGGPITTTGTINSDVSHRFNARLTLSATDAITTSSLDNQTTLYLLPFRGNIIDLYNGSDAWDAFELAAGGINITNAALAVDTNYDVFVFDSAGLTLEFVAWANATTRATALALQDGVYVKTGSTTKRYAGTIRTVDDAATAKFGDTTGGIDTVAERFVWNYYNQVKRIMRVADSTDSWAYGAGGWRSLNNNVANRVNFVQGLNESPVKMVHHGHATVTAVRSYYVGLALDAVNVNSCFLKGMCGLSATHLFLASEYEEYVAIGFHYLQLTENSPDGAVTVMGDGGAPNDIQAGAQGWLMG